MECENSWGQYKNKWNLQGQSRKNHVEFHGPWLLVMEIEIGVVTKFCGISMGQNLFCLEFPKVK